MNPPCPAVTVMTGRAVFSGLTSLALAADSRPPMAARAVAVIQKRLSGWVVRMIHILLFGAPEQPVHVTGGASTKCCKRFRQYAPDGPPDNLQFVGPSQLRLAQLLMPFRP